MKLILFIKKYIIRLRFKFILLQTLQYMRNYKLKISFGDRANFDRALYYGIEGVTFNRVGRDKFLAWLHSLSILDDDLWLIVGDFNFY